MADSSRLPPPESPSVPKPEPAKIGAAAVAGLVIAILGLVAFGWIADQVFLARQLGFDNAVRDAIHAVASPRLTSFMRALTFLGAPAFVSAAYLLCVAL